MRPADERAAQLERVRRELDEVLDPCSIGRGVPAGLPDMGMIVRADVEATADGRARLDLVLRLTAPGCTFQLYFDQQVRARLASIGEFDQIDIAWSEEFDWSDDDMSAELKHRLREKRSRLLRSAAAPGTAS